MRYKLKQRTKRLSALLILLLLAVSGYSDSEEIPIHLGRVSYWMYDDSSGLAGFDNEFLANGYFSDSFMPDGSIATAKYRGKVDNRYKSCGIALPSIVKSTDIHWLAPIAERLPNPYVAINIAGNISDSSAESLTRALAQNGSIRHLYIDCSVKMLPSPALAELGKMAHLEKLVLAGTYRGNLLGSREKLVWLTGLANLKHLAIYQYSKYLSDLEILPSLPKLESLSITLNTSNFSQLENNFPALERLEVNLYFGNDLETFPVLRELSDLRIYYPRYGSPFKITGNYRAILGSHKGLRKLHLAYPDKELMKAIAGLKELVSLSLDYCGNCVPEDWENLAVLKKVENITLKEVKISKQMIGAINQMDSLSALAFFGAETEAEQLPMLNDLRNLRSLLISRGENSPKLYSPNRLLKCFSSATQLKHLCLDGVLSEETIRLIGSKQIENLYVSSPTMGDEHLERIAARKLNMLVLPNASNITDKGFSALAAMQPLAYLKIDMLPYISRDVFISSMKKLKPRALCCWYCPVNINELGQENTNGLLQTSTTGIANLDLDIELKERTTTLLNEICRDPSMLKDSKDEYVSAIELTKRGFPEYYWGHRLKYMPYKGNDEDKGRKFLLLAIPHKYRKGCSIITMDERLELRNAEIASAEEFERLLVLEASSVDFSGYNRLHHNR